MHVMPKMPSVVQNRMPPGRYDIRVRHIATIMAYVGISKGQNTSLMICAVRVSAELFGFVSSIVF